MESNNSEVTAIEAPQPQRDVNEDPEWLKGELKRLKDHLIRVEEDYTQELLESEKRESGLRLELENVQQSVSELRAKLAEVSQTSKWQEKLSAAIGERDRALDDVSKLDDKVHRLTASMTNLQLVIEQMQKENEKKLAAQAKQHAAVLEAEIAVQNNLKAELEKYELKCQETSQALQAASRLTERIDQKESIIQRMKQEINDKSARISQLEREMADTQANYESKVDKQIIKNLLLSYFGAPSDKKREVERVLGKILDFTGEEMEKAGLIISQQAQPVRLSTSSLPMSPNSASSSFAGGDQGNTSLSKMFIDFLESESNPNPRRGSQTNFTRELARDFTRVALTPNRTSASNILLDSRSKSASSSANGSTFLTSVSSASTNTAIFVPASPRASPSPSLAINNILTPSIDQQRLSPAPESHHHLPTQQPPAPSSSSSKSSSRKGSLSDPNTAAVPSSTSGSSVPINPLSTQTVDKCNSFIINDVSSTK